MQIEKINGGTLFTNDINNNFLDSMKYETKNPFSLDVCSCDINIGVEMEFYIPLIEKQEYKKQEEIDDKVEHMIHSLSFYNNRVCYLPNSKEEDKDLSMTYLEKDDTLNSELGEGFELVSPMMSLQELPFYFNISSELLSDIAFSNYTTGVHFHISAPNLGDVDMFKLMTFLHAEDNLFENFTNRNAYTKSLETVFLNTSEDSFNKEISGVTKKYDLLSIDTNHIELRVFGGDDVYNKTSLILENLNTFLKNYRLSCSPELERDLYHDLVQKNLENGNHRDEGFEYSRLEQLTLEYAKDNNCSLMDSLFKVIDTEEAQHMVKEDFIEVFADKYEETDLKA